MAPQSYRCRRLPTSVRNPERSRQFMKKYFPILFIASAACLHGAEPKKTRDQMVLEDRDALEKSVAWIYNDLKKAFAEAERSKKPLLVVHRCIP